jgi:hypothetical protein
MLSKTNERNTLDQDYFKILDSLPVSARRWLQCALPEDFNLTGRVTLDQKGEMEIRGRWTPFKARGVYSSPPLSFNWQARLHMLPGVWIVAEDGHANGQGWGGAKLWGLLSMGKRTDPEVLATQVIRNIGELPLLPMFAVTDPNLEWSAAGENSFEVRSSVGDVEVMVRFEVDEEGDVVSAYSPSRPYDTPEGYAEAPWKYEFSDHREFGRVRIPAMAVATYEKDDGAWVYFRGKIMSVTFEAGELDRS